MKCFLFSGLEGDEMNRVLEMLPQAETIKRGTELFRFGYVCILKEGNGKICRVAESGEKLTVRTAASGDVFGAVSVFGSWSNSRSTITAVTNCQAIYISEELLKKMISDFPKVALNYISYLTDRIRFLNNRLDTFSAKSTELKIYEYLVSCADEKGVVSLNFSMSEFARRLKIGRTSLYRGFDSLENGGFITREKSKILLKGDPL